jgi:hypothetical protein
MHLIFVLASLVREWMELHRFSREVMSDQSSLFQKTLGALLHTNEELREKAASDLMIWTEQGVTRREGIEALQWAAQTFPPRRDSSWHGFDTVLVEAAGSNPDPAYVNIIRECFPVYSVEARWEALALLSSIHDRGSAYTYMDLMRTAMRDHGFTLLPVAPLLETPRFPDIFFPGLFTYLPEPNHSQSVWSVALRYCQEGKMDANGLCAVTGQLLQDYLELRVDLDKAEPGEGQQWMWEGGYASTRFKAALLLDLMGYVRSEAVVAELMRAEESPDPRLRLFALISLVRHGMEPGLQTWIPVAQSAETCNLLYERLGHLNRLDLFPVEFGTQDAFAESDMVSWLMYPTELGRAPDEIEQMHVEPFDQDEDGPGGAYEIYLFRFRTSEPKWAAEKGWMAGIAGPFERGAQPSIESLGATFSCFESWDSKTPDEHMESILSLFDSRS